jgi:hypothetical protein
MTMAEEARAMVQYGDMRGTISIDGWNGVRAISFGGCGKGYWPIGIELYGEPMHKNDAMNWYVSILAVDESILAKPGPDGVAQYAKQNDSIPVFRFRQEVKLEKIPDDIKRISIVLQDKTTEGKPLMVHEGH